MMVMVMMVVVVMTVVMMYTHFNHGQDRSTARIEYPQEVFAKQESVFPSPFR